jgi:hypothetical protein
VTFVMLRKLQCGDVDLEAKELFVMHVEWSGPSDDVLFPNEWSHFNLRYVFWWISLHFEFELLNSCLYFTFVLSHNWVFSCPNRHVLPNQTLSLRSFSLCSLQDSNPLNSISPKEDVDSVNKRKNRKLKGNNDDEGKENYYCKYCNVTWPIHHFKNRQQFGAHCSNCSRKRKFKSTCL